MRRLRECIQQGGRQILTHACNASNDKGKMGAQLHTFSFSATQSLLTTTVLRPRGCMSKEVLRSFYT